MIFKKVIAHPMYHDFYVSPLMSFLGEYNDKHQLINVFSQSHQKLIPIIGTYQWQLADHSAVYFIEEDYTFDRVLN